MNSGGQNPLSLHMAKQLPAHVDEVSAEHLLQFLARAFANSCEGDDVCEVVGPLYRGSHSRVFRAQGIPFQFPVAIKICRDPLSGVASPAQAETEFRGLEKVTAATAVSGHDQLVPRPVSLFREHGLVMMEWIQGRTAGGLCHDWRTTDHALVDAMRCSGVWLRAFHSAHYVAPAVVDAVAMINAAQDDFHECGAAKVPLVVEAFALLSNLVGAVRDIVVPRSWTHGDYKPDNVTLSADRAICLDTGANYENAVVFDLAHFLNHLELDLYSPRGARNVFRRKLLTNAFLDGYGAQGAIDPLLLDWVRLVMLLRLLATRQRNSVGLRGRYVRWAFERALAKRVRALAAA